MVRLGMTVKTPVKDWVFPRSGRVQVISKHFGRFIFSVY